MFIALFTAAYALGSINTSILALAVLRSSDPRTQGSGNAGATNVLRTAGPKVAIPVLLVDLGKAYGTIWLGRACGLGETAALLALPYLLGNLFPIFHGLRGGKGVAASVGCLFAICPGAMLLGGIVFVVAVAATRIVSVGSLLMLTSTALWAWFFSGNTHDLEGIVAGVLALTAMGTHRQNIQRLIHVQEPRISWRKRESDQNTPEK
ncbi:MAG: glycerol-3-phosphate acyltransferase [Myxococcota bacterium]|nr:glycerol-3-phosphate acyltransferase [Myxococcota bacterium]